MSKKTNKGNQPPSGSNRVAKIDQQFLTEMESMISDKPKDAIRLIRIMGEVLNSPFHGLGKPKPLKHEEGWSRRVTHMDRLQYSVEADGIYFFKTLGHY